MPGLVWEHSPILGWTLTEENLEHGQDDETGVGYCGNHTNQGTLPHMRVLLWAEDDSEETQCL